MILPVRQPAGHWGWPWHRFTHRNHPCLWLTAPQTFSHHSGSMHPPQPSSTPTGSQPPPQHTAPSPGQVFDFLLSPFRLKPLFFIWPFANRTILLGWEHSVEMAKVSLVIWCFFFALHSLPSQAHRPSLYTTLARCLPRPLQTCLPDTRPLRAPTRCRGTVCMDTSTFRIPTPLSASWPRWGDLPAAFWSLIQAPVELEFSGSFSLTRLTCQVLFLAPTTRGPTPTLPWCCCMPRPLSKAPLQAPSTGLRLSRALISITPIRFPIHKVSALR